MSKKQILPNSNNLREINKAHTKITLIVNVNVY